MEEKKILNENELNASAGKGYTICGVGTVPVGRVETGILKPAMVVTSEKDVAAYKWQFIVEADADLAAKDQQYGEQS